MAELERVVKKQEKLQHQETGLKGTFVSVMIVGGFIAACWLFAFIVFVIRNGG